jgi:pteridine reductase
LFIAHSLIAHRSALKKTMPNTPSSSPRPAALVTGAAIRLGKAIALGLAGAGYDIALHYNSSVAPAEETAAEIRALGVDCHLFAQDLSQTAQLGDFLGKVYAAMPRLNVLVNSASAYTQAMIKETTPDIWATQFAVNLTAPVFLTQAFAAQVGQGNVVNIIDNKIGFNQPQYAAYLLAKKGLAEFTRMASVEFAPAVRVNGVAPGVVLPAGTRSPEYVAWRLQGIPLKMQGDPKQIVQAIRYCLDNEFVTGQILVVDGGESLMNIGQNAATFGKSADV